MRMKILDHLEEWLITFLMGAATLIIFASVMHRYASGYAIPGVQDWLLSLNFGWTQELCIIMFVWMAKFGAAYGVRTGWENGMHQAVFSSLGIDVGDLPEGPTTPDLEWPTWIVYSAVPLGSYLMCFRFLQVTWSFLRTGELPHHDHGHVEGLEEEGPPKPGEEDIIYSMEDNLHPQDLRDGIDRREHTSSAAAPEVERRSGIERRKDRAAKDEGDQQ
ncbi:MAG: TRAP transporter small permease subunit [Rhodocyclales bacterium]|nr:TRAP transporter small permease subunit [Rhodocyclales bacterium]